VAVKSTNQGKRESVGGKITSDHILDEFCVAGVINVTIVSLGSFILDVGSVDGNASDFFFRSLAEEFLWAQA